MPSLVEVRPGSPLDRWRSVPSHWKLALLALPALLVALLVWPRPTQPLIDQEAVRRTVAAEPALASLVAIDGDRIVVALTQDDGTRRDGLAGYLCTSLADAGALRQRHVLVQLVDPRDHANVLGAATCP